MQTSELEYHLPPELIAQHAAERRDISRLLVVDRAGATLRHERFAGLPQLLPPRCLLVMNDTRVLPARLRLRRATGGQIAGLFLQEVNPGEWEVMLTSGRRLRVGEELSFEGSSRHLRLVSHVEEGTWRASPIPGGDALAILNACGHPPLPPYIKRSTRSGGGREEESGGGGERGSDGHDARQDDQQGTRDCLENRTPEDFDVDRYQTIYARNPGAVAAPTAGLHFTPEVFASLKTAGIEHAFVTLHVGPGTFAPIRCENLSDHRMHAEWYDCPPETAESINTARTQGRAIVAVGTTSVRVLESCADEAGRVQSGNGWTRIFIYPPYQFRAVDLLLTNFHLPGSTLLALAFAFAGRELILRAYDEAIREHYRFYSYGDAMLIR